MNSGWDFIILLMDVFRAVGPEIQSQFILCLFRPRWRSGSCWGSPHKPFQVLESWGDVQLRGPAHLQCSQCLQRAGRALQRS